MTRRAFAGMPALLAGPRSTDVKIEELRISYEDYKYRAPYKFGGMLVDRVTLCNVNCVVKTRAGKSAAGFGSMPMGNMWSFPAPDLSYDTTLNAMKSLAEKIGKITRDFPGYAHPLDINFALEPEYLKAAAGIEIARPIPKLCTLVTASPFDAALHDAFGKLHGRNAFNTSGKGFVHYDLAHYLGDEFKGEYLDRYIQEKPTPRIRMYHSVGAADALTKAELQHPVGDGLPETLVEWIPYNGVLAIKIKLNGNDLKWDVDRVAGIDRVTVAAQQARGVKEWLYSLDFNEKCPNVQYFLDFIRDLKTEAPGAFARIQYIEQPTQRDLERHRDNVMFQAAKLVPVVIDESLTGLDRLRLAREMGYTGAALKVCKGHSNSLLLAAAVQKYKMFRCVQDLTCPGASLIHSAGLACHVPGSAAIEANAHEYVPAANKGWEDKLPGIFRVRDGWLDTSVLGRPGIGAV
jgi:L-alanine-DL-glutamate epimerase-like enolase superfamily enzyme